MARTYYTLDIVWELQGRIARVTTFAHQPEGRLVRCACVVTRLIDESVFTPAPHMQWRDAPGAAIAVKWRAYPRLERPFRVVWS